MERANERQAHAILLANYETYKAEVGGYPENSNPSSFVRHRKTDFPIETPRAAQAPVEGIGS